VLVQRNEDGRTVRDAVAALGVPVVMLASTSVFLSSAARDWLTLLSALEQPHRVGLTRAAALTEFVGWSAERLATADDQVLDELSARLRGWAELLTERGVAALLENVVATTGLTERVLSREHGERELTDVRHVGQALHQAATEAHGGVASLVEWLRHRIADAAEDVDEERSRRLDSDAEAVQILTVHRSKGLEYPVVYAPFLADRYVPSSPDPLRLHDDAGARVLDVGGPSGPGYDARRAVHAQEDAGESLRLAYVAVTRARCHVVTYWAPTRNTGCAPLHRLLFGQRTADGVLPDAVAVPTDAEARTRLLALAESSGGGISVEPVRRRAPTALAPPAPSTPAMAVRSFERVLDQAWARTSYSRLTAGLHDLAHSGPVLSEPEAPGTVDEPVVVPAGHGVDDDTEATEEAVPSPMADLPSGTAFGTLVHGILEDVDFAVPDLATHLAEVCAAAGSERFLDLPPSSLAEALLPSLRTPLGPLAADHRLVDISRGDRLNELDFELPLAGGDHPTGEATVAEVVALLRQHLLPTDPLTGYADDLTTPLLASRGMRGFLAGSIDLVLRIRAEDGTPRYLVADYKTNRLGTAALLTAADYRPEAMTRAMRQAHYPLQALLYSVALHRFLRWRQPGYDPEVHLGGVLYLFLRGMCGVATPVVDGTPCGVFSWGPPAALVTALSDVLHGGAG